MLVEFIKTGVVLKNEDELDEDELDEDEELKKALKEESGESEEPEEDYGFWEDENEGPEIKEEEEEEDYDEELDL